MRYPAGMHMVLVRTGISDAAGLPHLESDTYEDTRRSIVPRRYVDTRWGQVHVRDTETAGPAIVLLHESPLSSAVYEPVLPALGLRMRAIAPDTPGYGASDGPDGQAEIRDYAATLLEAIDALGLERFAVAGVHTG